MARGAFSEPRGWADCHECGGGDYNRWAEEDRFALCPECGQPPRCEWGTRLGSTRSEDGRCPRPATTLLDGDHPHLCGQHERAWALRSEEEEWGEAGKQLGYFRKLAEGLCNDALLAALDLARAECQMRQESAQRERRMIWEGDGS